MAIEVADRSYPVDIDGGAVLDVSDGRNGEDVSVNEGHESCHYTVAGLILSLANR